jgi:hypothetical protein
MTTLMSLFLILFFATIPNAWPHKTTEYFRHDEAINSKNDFSGNSFKFKL